MAQLLARDDVAVVLEEGREHLEGLFSKVDRHPAPAHLA
jgi:hypothetical protein